jgi:hypothetical protein
MSHAAVDVVVPAESRPFEAAVSGEFDYKPVPVMAPLSLFLAVCAAASLLSPYAIAIGVAAIVTSVCCLLQIRRSGGDLGGRRLTLTAFALAVLFSISGATWHGYVYATEVPEGYDRLSFSWLAKQAPYYEDGKLKLADTVLDLDGKQVFVKGYIYPGRQTTGITQFVFLKDTGQCCFGGQPKLSDMILVDMQGEKTVDHDPINNQYRQYSVAGVFRAEPILQDGEVRQLYRLEANHVR